MGELVTASTVIEHVYRVEGSAVVEEMSADSRVRPDRTVEVRVVADRSVKQQGSLDRVGVGFEGLQAVACAVRLLKANLRAGAAPAVDRALDGLERTPCLLERDWA